MKANVSQPMQQNEKTTSAGVAAKTVKRNYKPMVFSLSTLLTLALAVAGCGQRSTNTAQGEAVKTVYDYSLQDKEGKEVSLAEYKGKTLLIVNTATACGFTPQYAALEAMYGRLKAEGLEILDIPCNQFGNQAPGTDGEILEFCQVKFGIDFPQFKKSEVNGDNELPLYTWLKSQKGFEGFDRDNSLTPRLESMFDKADPEWRAKSDIKWNFTKFLIDRKGNVVARIEPTKDMAQVEELVKAVLGSK